jgi:uncharacterized repeat protein (TIGR01451 family)
MNTVFCLLRHQIKLRCLGKRTIGLIFLPVGLSIAGNSLFAGVASADIAVNKSFNPISVSTNQPSKISIDLFNSNSVAATGTSFTDNLPLGVKVANPANITNSCGGTVTAVVGATSISLTGGIIPAASGGVGNCKIDVDVVSTATGTFINTIPANAVTSSQGLNPLKGEATLVVSPSVPITGIKKFSVANLHGSGSAATMTITLNNPNGYDLTGTSFTDTFPAGLLLTASPTTTNTCLGTVTATPNTNKFILTGGIIPAGGSCNLTTQVEADTSTIFQDGLVTNSIASGGVTTTPGINNTSAIQGSVQVQRGAQIAKSFTPTTIQTGQTSVLTLTLKNFNSTAITAANLSDTMPANLTANSLVSNTCGGTPTVTAGTVDLSGATIPAAPAGIGFGSCNIQVNVTSAQIGSYTNSIPAGNFNGINYSAATAALNVVQATSVSMTKAFLPSSGIRGNQSTLTLTLKNVATSPANITNFTDDLLTTMGAGFTVAASPIPTTTCGGTVVATAGSTSITKTDGTIPASGSCTITVPVAISPTAALSAATNTVPINSLQTDQGNNTAAVSASLNVQTAVSLNKAFSGTGIRGGQNNLTITLNNAGSTPANITSFTDDLTTMGTGFTVAASPAATTTCTGGTVTATPGSTSITETNGTIPANGSCVITVPVAIDPTAPLSTATNTVPVDGLQTDKGNNPTAASAPLTVKTAVSVKKSLPATGTQGGQSNLTITLTNDGITPANITSFTDDLTTMGTGFTVAASPAATTTCTGGTVTATPGSTSIIETNGAIPASGSCIITVPVAIDPNVLVGRKTNTIPVDGLQTDKGNNPTAATANLTVQSAVTVTKSFASSNGVQGGISSLTITLGNGTAIPADITSLTDSLTTMGTGFTVAASPAPTTTCGGTVIALPGSTSITKTDGTIPANGTCTITLPVAVPINASTNTHTNTIPVGNLQTSLGSNEALAKTDLDVQGAVTLRKSFSPTSVPINALSRLTISVRRAANAPALTGIKLTDNLPSGMSISNVPNLVSTCGGSVNAIAGANAIFLTGGSLTGGAASTCDISVDVRAPGTTGRVTNTIPANSLVTDQGATYNSSTTANLTTTGQYLTLNKSFSPSSITLGQTSTLTILMLNNNPGALSLTNTAVTDLLPTGMSVATVPNYTFTGCTGTITATPGSDRVSLSGGSIAVGAICTLKLNITSTFAGNLTNILPLGTATSNQNVTNSSKSAATLTLLGTSDLQVLSKNDGVATVIPGGTTTYTIVAKNAGPDNVAGATLKDTAPAGMTIDSWTCVASVGSSCDAASGTGDISAGLSLLNQGTATFIVNATVSPTMSGPITNVATISAPPTVSDLNSTNNSAQDTDLVTNVVPSGKADLILVKRITAINTTNIATTFNDLSSTDDNHPNWPLPIDNTSGMSSFVAGNINSMVLPGDIVEYTIYFLDNGTSDATQVSLCDFIPKNSTYLNDSLSLATGSGNPVLISDFAGGVDIDGGFYPNISTFPRSCNTGVDKGNGAIVVNVGTVTKSTGSGTPPSSYGFIRFRAQVN